jgi:hypothetical protein
MTRRVDDYELKARIAPGLIVALPVLALVLWAVPEIQNWRIFTATSVFGVALIYGLGRLAQARGEAIEAALWKQWDGPPSTRFLRHRDSTFGQELKDSIRSATESNLGAKMPTRAEEEANPDHADQSTFDVFRRIRQLLRQRDPGGLWHRQNAEYGFCRNLLGCRGPWLWIAAVATACSGYYGAYAHRAVLNAASVVGLVSLICAIYMGWCVLPAATKRSANNYAESAWMAFLHLDTSKKPIAKRSSASRKLVKNADR